MPMYRTYKGCLIDHLCEQCLLIYPEIGGVAKSEFMIQSLC